MSSATKPQLRGILYSTTKKHFVGMAVVSIGAGLAYKTFVGDVRKQRYADFYKYVIHKYFCYLF